MSDKIRISLEDVRSPVVDAKIAHQQNVERANEAFRRQLAASAAATSASPLGFFYNAIVYLTLFGLGGGMLAWPMGEVIQNRLSSGAATEAAGYFATLAYVDQQVAEGEISDVQAGEIATELHRRVRHNDYVRAIEDESISEEEREFLVKQLESKVYSIGMIETIVYFAASGAALSFFLSIAAAAVGRNLREAIINGSVGICLGILGGVVVGLFINQLYQAMGGGAEEGEMSGPLLAKQIFARSLGWAIVGLFLAAAPGVVMKSFKRLLIGLIGGFLGGLIGGALFDPFGMVFGSGILSRGVGLTAIGALTGLGTGLIENVAKDGWMKVIGGLIAGKQFILYKNPTLIGSSPQCDIYLFKDVAVAPQHAAIRRTPGGYEIQDTGGLGMLINGLQLKKARLAAGDVVQIGGTTFAFQERAKAK